MTVETITNESFEMQVYVHQKKLMDMHFIDIILLLTDVRSIVPGKMHI